MSGATMTLPGVANITSNDTPITVSLNGKPKDNSHKYRYYTCSMNCFGNYICKAQEPTCGNKGDIPHDTMNKGPFGLTKLLSVPKYVPEILDPLYLHLTSRPEIIIKK